VGRSCSSEGGQWEGLLLRFSEKLNRVSQTHRSTSSPRSFSMVTRGCFCERKGWIGI
jgi:hypothetical protein